MLKKFKKRKKYSTKQLATLAIVLAVVLATSGFFMFKSRHKDKLPTVTLHNGSVATANPNVPGGSNNSGGADSSKGGKEVPAPVGSNVKPATPTGNFVSNHFPNLSGSPEPNTETSVCTTTPGVKCLIRLTRGSTTINLPTQTTAATGSTYWNWNLKQYNVGVGAWTVSAVATNGNNITTATDSLQLMVKQ